MRAYLAIRELLQNALDALRHRAARFKRAGIVWNDGRVLLEHVVDNNEYEVLRCTDNGAGMDEAIVKSFLTKVGRSYYRSPEFEQERIALKQAGADFDPCARFGIGFMSVFMLGDRIRIATRRDHGLGNEWGAPLEVEINGLGGLVVIRPGRTDAPVGTTVEVTCRKKPRFLDARRDRVRLVGTIEEYAVAAEFPIEARCAVPGIEGAIEKAPGINRPVKVVAHLSKSSKLYEQDLSELDPLLSGYISEAMLVDAAGLPATANSDVRWKRMGGSTDQYVLEAGSQQIDPWNRDRFKLAADGVLIASNQGHAVGHGANFINIAIHMTYNADIRGALKPSLTPARTIPDDRWTAHGWQIPGSWARIGRLLRLGNGRLWEHILEEIDAGLKPLMFWELACIYHAELSALRSGTLWKRLPVPVISGDTRVAWHSPFELGPLRYVKRGNAHVLSTNDGRTIELDPAMGGSSFKSTPRLQPLLETVLWSLGEVDLDNGALVLHFGSLRDQGRTPIEDAVGRWFQEPTQQFRGPLVNCLFAARFVNRNHPLMRFALAHQFDEPCSSIVEFFAHLHENRLRLPQYNKAAEKRDTLREIGRHFLATEWGGSPTEMLPPYCVWTEDTGFIEIGSEDFQRWADILVR